MSKITVYMSERNRTKTGKLPEPDSEEGFDNLEDAHTELRFWRCCNTPSLAWAVLHEQDNRIIATNEDVHVWTNLSGLTRTAYRNLHAHCFADFVDTCKVKIGHRVKYRISDKPKKTAVDTVRGIVFAEREGCMGFSYRIYLLNSDTWIPYADVIDDIEP